MTAPLMRAGVAGKNGVEIRDIPRPVPTEDQILVRIAAAGLNRADLATAKAAPGTAVGLEWAGEIVEIGSRVTAFKPGQFVMCSGGGGYAEYAVTDAGRAIAFDPRELDMRKAATLLLALLTAHDALITHGGLQPGQSVLVTGATSAVGLMAVQIARLKGASVIAATSRDATKRTRLKEAGATLTFDAGNPAWADDLIAATGNLGVDVVLDMVSGETLNAAMKATRVLGRIINIGRLGGNIAPFNYDLHALRRLTYVGVTFRTRSTAEIREITTRMHADLWPAVCEGRLSLPVDRVFKLEDAAAAHQAMAANSHFGKIVLMP